MKYSKNSIIFFLIMIFFIMEVPVNAKRKSVDIKISNVSMDIIKKISIVKLYLQYIEKDDETRADLQDFYRIKNQMLTETNGYIKNLKIKKIDVNTYNAEADVVKHGNIFEDKTALKQLIDMIGKFKVGIMITEMNDGKWEYNATSSSIIANELSAIGFNIHRHIEMPPEIKIEKDTNLIETGKIRSSIDIDANRLKNGISSDVEYSSDFVKKFYITNWFIENYIRGNLKEIKRFSDKNELDFIIFGKVISKYIGNEENKYVKKGLFPVETVYDINVLSNIDGYNIGGYNDKIIKSDASVVIAKEQGVRELGVLASLSIAGSILKNIKTGISSEVEMINLDYKDFMRMKDELLKSDYINEINIKSFKTEKIIFYIQTYLSIDELVQKILSINQNIELQQINSRKIIFAKK